MLRSIDSLKIAWFFLVILNVLTRPTEQINHGDHLPLKNYQELVYENFILQSNPNRINKRQTSVFETPYLQSNHLKFRAFDRDFSILLKRDFSLVSNSIEIELRYSSKKSDFLKDFLTSNYYTGIVENEPNSHVILYFETNSLVQNDKPLIFGQIRLANKEVNTVYYIEPLVQNSTSNEKQKYIIYKSEDVDSGVVSNGVFNSTVCHPKYADNFSRSNQAFNDPKGINKNKKKRNANKESLKNRCGLALVADHKFFKEIGNSNEKLTSAYMMNIIAAINNIFTKTQWNLDDFDDENLKSNFGFVIEKIIIHTEPTINQFDHYNNANSSTNSDKILDLFSENDWSEFCLAHLFTFQTFDASVLGLAYVGSPWSYAIGGICSSLTSRNRKIASANTGLSSYKSSSQKQGRLLQKEAELVTAHEFGHNWGSEHDPLKPECTPSIGDGGNYLMYPYANQGNEVNNFLFSPCSINYISEVLKTKTTCFQKETLTFCGNDRVEPGEECDAGMRGRQSIDPCCDYNCKLKKDAQCSDTNHYCCLNCKIAPLNYTCFSSPNYFECFQDYSLCDGQSKDCPSPREKPMDTICNSYDQGRCSDKGRCNSLCKQIDDSYDQCKCSESNERCMICCRNVFVNNSVCQPIHTVFQNVPLTYLSEGRPCFDGVCEKNVCKAKVKDNISRFWKVIQKASISSFVEFARRNIVAAVIVISLLIWIPISCCLHFCYDKRIKSEYQQAVRRERQKYHNERQFQAEEDDFMNIDNVED